MRSLRSSTSLTSVQTHSLNVSSLTKKKIVCKMTSTKKLEHFLMKKTKFFRPFFTLYSFTISFSVLVKFSGA